MNRRSFLRFLGLAPVAAPIAVKTFAQSPERFIGIDAAAIDMASIEVYPPDGGYLVPADFVEALKGMMTTPKAVRAAEALKPSGIDPNYTLADCMRDRLGEHDIFDHERE